MPPDHVAQSFKGLLRHTAILLSTSCRATSPAAQSPLAVPSRAQTTVGGPSNAILCCYTIGISRLAVVTLFEGAYRHVQHQATGGSRLLTGFHSGRVSRENTVQTLHTYGMGIIRDRLPTDRELLRGFSPCEPCRSARSRRTVEHRRIPGGWLRYRPATSRMDASSAPLSLPSRRTGASCG